MFRLWLLLVILGSEVLSRPLIPPGQDTQEFWQKKNEQELLARLALKTNTNEAKNVLFFLGDGMSMTTQTAARILKGQLQGKSGEEGHLEWETFPYNSRSKTYSLDKQVADSASTASAYLSGVKANQGTIGVNGKVEFGDCEAQSNKANHLVSIMEQAQRDGKATGVITTTRITHASPAGAFAHVASRGWEGRSPDAKLCPDIATQLITSSPGNKLDVIMGGGRREFIPKKEKGSNRKDNRNLIKEYVDSKKNHSFAVVYTKDDMEKAVAKDMEYILGLFNNNHMKYFLDRPSKTTEPTLEDMVVAAIKLMKKNPRGMVLFIEGGKIDLAHHNSKAKKALYETLELEKAVIAARALTSEQDTLTLVTADHSHTMTISGYPPRGTNILGFAGKSTISKRPYTSLSYANGPGSTSSNKTLTDKEVNDDDYTQNSTVYLDIETHGGDDVAVHAVGPFSHLFTGVHEQTLIPRVISYAACISDTKADHCTKTPKMGTSI